jgi:hypothetical protein
VTFLLVPFETMIKCYAQDETCSTSVSLVHSDGFSLDFMETATEK